MADITATNAQSGGSTHTLSYGPFSGSILGGAITFTNVTFTFTLDGSNKVATVAVGAASATLSLGSAVTSSFGTITGSYNISTKTFALSLTNANITLSSFVNIGANSMNLAYTGGSTGQSVNTINPGNSTTPLSTDTVTMFTLATTGAYLFAGVNGSANASSTAPSSQAANAEGLSITGVNLALAVMSSTSSSAAVYYGLSESGGTVALVGLPGAFTFNVSNLSVNVNAGNTAANGYVVDFDTTSSSGFTPGTGLTVQTGGTPTSIALDFNQPLVEASGTVDLNLSGYVYVIGNMFFQAGSSATVNLTDGTISGGVVSDNGGTASVSVLEVAATNVTVFAGINGPTSSAPGTIPGNAVGLELNNASFALALMITSTGTKYYGLQAGAGGTLVPVKTDYNSSGSYTLTGLTPGVTYQWTQGSPVSPSTTSNDTSVTVGSAAALTTSGVTFVAPSSGSVTLTGTASALITASVAPFGMTALGLPTGITITAGAVSVSINKGVTSGGTATTYVVDFDSSFTTAAASSPNPRVGGLTFQTPASQEYLDMTSPLLSVSGSLTLDFKGFIYVTGNISFVQGGNIGGTLNLTTGSTTVASMLQVGASDVTIFAGVNGPATNSTAEGIELDNAGFALALIYGANNKTYYGLQATAGSLSALGLPAGFNLSGSNLGAAINGSNDSTGGVVNFDSSFTSGTGGKGLLVSTGGGNNVTLDFATQLVQVYGGINLQFGSYIGISGGFDYTQTSGTVTNIVLGSGAYTGASDLVFTLGTASSTLFTASGSLNMTITAGTSSVDGTTAITSASLSVPEIKVANVLDVVSPSVTITNISIDNKTGAISTSGSSILTITATSATLFPGSSSLSGSIAADPNDPVSAANGGTEVNGFNGTFNLSSGAFAVRLGIFTLNVSTVLTAVADDVNITYSPGAGSSQQIVSISSLTATFNSVGGGAIKGTVTNLVIYGDGFKFDSATLSYTGDLTLGSVLKLTNPSVTLTNFSVTFDGSNTTLSASTLSVAVDSASVTVGAFKASATGLTITVSLTDGSTTIVAATLDFEFGSYLSLMATTITINTNPASATDSTTATIANAYLSVGTATATVKAGSFQVTGTATSFSVMDVNGTAEFVAGNNFTVTLTTPSSGSLLFPSWLGFSITKFEISWQGNNFNTDPSNFQITLSASITSIQGLPGGVTVSGEITDAVIDLGMLENGQFPITSIGSVGGSVSGTLFGMEVNASFVLGIVQFNAENEIVSGSTVTQLVTNSDGSVTETPVTTNPDTTVKNSVLYVGVAGGAQIPGVGGVQIYIGFSSLGPLTVYLSAEFPLILDPDTGLAIGGFSGGVIFDYTIPTPQQPSDLATLALSPAKITISQWQQQLRDQTVTQYTSSSGGTNLSAAYNQPFVIEAGVTLYDAYLTADAFTITGNIAIQINPASPNDVNIFLSGTATFGASVSFNAYLYLNIVVSGATSSATVMFLAQEPASTPIETFGGTLRFGFVDSNGNPITPTTVAPTIESEWIAAGTAYDSTGAASVGTLQAGTYTWTPGTNDTSLTVGSTVYLASSATNGAITFTTTSAQPVSLAGTANSAITGTLGSAGTVTGAQYTITTFPAPPAVAGFYISIDGFAQFSAFGALTATVSGSVTLTVTTTFAKIDLSGDLSVSGLGDLATASGELVVDYSGGLSSLQIYGALQIQTGSGLAQLQSVGLYVNGAATFILNTTSSPQTVYLPDPNNPHIAADATQFNITDTQSFEVTIAGVGSTPAAPTYASLSYKVGSDTVLNMQGSFDLKISSSGLTMFADIHSLSVGPSSTPFLTFQGFGLFVINSQGFAAEMSLSLMSNSIEGITLDAQFTLVLNTTQMNVVYTIPATLPPVTIPGSSPPATVTSLTIPAGPPQGALQTNGTYGTNVGPVGPYIVIMGSGTLNIYSYAFTGLFYFQLSDSSAGPLVEMYVNVMGNLGFGTVNVTGAFQLSSSGVVVLLQASGSTSAPTSFGAGVSLVINAELAINTTASPVSSIGGVALTDTNGNPLTILAKSAQVVASGTLTLHFGPGSLVINGIFTTSIVTTGSGVTEVDTTTITANGTLTAKVAGTTLFQGNAVGILLFVAPGPSNPNAIGTNGLGLAGELSLTLGSSSPLSGAGFSFNGKFDMEVNTTDAAQQVTVQGLSSPVTISAGPNGSTFGSAYAEIHAKGALLFGSNTGTASAPVYNGFVLNGDFYLTVGSAGLAVSASVNLGIYISGTSLVSVSGMAAMSISSSGFAASLVVTAGIADPSGLYGFNGTLKLQVNTTGVQQTIGTVVIPAGPGLGAGSSVGSPYFQVFISGSLAFGTTNAIVSPTSTGLYVAGSFDLTISPTGLVVAASGTLTAYVLGSQLLSMSATGALIINSSGIAGELSLSRSGGDPLDSTGLYSFSGSFNLQLNTTGNNYYIGSDGTVYTAVPAVGITYITIGAGADGSTTNTGFYFVVEASGALTFGTASNGFSLSGNIYLSVSAAGLAVSATTSFTASVLGTTLLKMNATGALIITAAGIAGELTLTFATGSTNPLDGTGFGFTGTFSLVLNTTSINYYIQANGSISTTVPIAGATSANTISAGPNGDTAAPGSAYFEIDASGSLLFGTAQNGFSLTGDLFLSIGSAGLAVSTNDTFNVNVGGSSVISLTASGAMEITSAGLAASLTLTASSGNSLFSNSSLPFGFSGVFTFQLNTTNKAVNDTVGSTQLVLPMGPYFQIYVSGTLGLGNTSATTGLFLNGTFYLTISSNGLAIAATASLTATFGGTTLLSLGASGGLVLTSSGLAGAINLTIGSGSSDPLNGTGFSFTGTFNLQVNTTGSTYYFWSNGTVSTNAPNSTSNPGVSVITTVSAGPDGSSTGSTYFQVYASGAITFGSSSNGFALSGSFYLAIGTAGLSVSVTATFTASVLGNQLISVSAAGAMEITSSGLAASITLTVPSMGISGVFTLSGTFAFQINTTNQAVASIGTVTVNLPAGPYFELSVTHASLIFGGGGTGLGLTNGSFILSINSSGMAVSASATLGLTVASTSLATFTATGALLITSSGIAAKLTLTLTSGFSQSGSSGFSFSASFVLELNTTSSAISTINNVTVSLPRGPYFEILASGSLMMGGLVSITGSFTFTLSSSGVLISMNAALSVFGISFTANGFAAIYTSGGIALQITLSVGNSTNPTVTIIPGILALSGSFMLQINTTGNSSFNVNGTNYTITAGTVFNISVSASLDVFGFSLATAAINIDLTTTGFSASGTTSFNFFGFATFNVDFYFSANFNNGSVQYWFYGGVYLQLGSSGFNIHGSLTFEVSNVNTTDQISINGVHGSYYGQAITNGITISINGGVTAFGFDFASIGASISINGTDVSFSVYVSVSFYFFSIGGTVTIDLGSIIPVPSPPPPPTGTTLNSATTIDGQSFGSGTLLINVGQYANSNRGVSPLASENYTITYLGAGAGGTEDVSVSAVGVNGGSSQEYDNISEIVVPDADIGSGTSNMTVTISGSVTLPVVIFAGSGTNSFHVGSSSSTIYGTDGNDTVYASSGHVTFYAGSGTNVFNGSGGTATITGSSGNDTIIGGTGNVTFNVGSGSSTFTGGGTGSTANTINDPGSVLVMESSYSSYSLTGTSSTAATLTYGGNTDTLSNASGDITVSLIGAASGTQTFSVSNYSGPVTINANGNSTSNVTTTITSPSGNLTVNGNTVTESNGPAGTITLLNTNGSNTYAYGTLNLDGGSGANTFTINSWSGSGAVSLDGMGGGDTYIINFQGSGSFTANINDTGSSGTDSMIVNGAATTTTLYVTNGAVTFGSQTANYNTSIENMTVYTASNGENVDVSSTSIATTINTGAYTDTVNVGSNAATTNTGGTLNNIITVLTVSGTSTNDTLNLDDSGDAGANTGTLTATTLGGVFGTNGSLSYSDIKNLNLKLGSGADVLDVTATSSVTGINASLGTNTLNIGSHAATTNTGGVLGGIKGPLTIVGSTTTTVNVDDTGDAAATGVLTGTTLKGLGMISGGITYSGLTALKISLANSGNTFTFSTTSASTTTTLNSGTGTDTVNMLTDAGTTIINGQGGGDTINVFNDAATTTINELSGNNNINIQATHAATNVNDTAGANIITIGSKAPFGGGIINNIQGAVIVTGDGTDTLDVDDTASTNSKTGLLTSTALTGLGMGAGGIAYGGLQTLTISLGSGGNTINVESTYSTTVTTLNVGAGINIINVTSNAPTTSGGVVAGIAGQLIVNGQGSDTLNLNDTGDSGSGTLTQTTTTLTGLGMGTNGIEYLTVETLNIYLGNHNNTVYIQGNPAITTENLNTGTGSNIISIGSQAQSAIVTDTNNADAYTTLGNATNTGSVLDNVQGLINITGSGADTLNVDDSGSNTGAEGGLWSNKLEFLDPATFYTSLKVTINFTGISGIYISLSQAADQFLVVDTITSASTTPVVVIDGNGGDDTFLVFDSHAVMTINGGSGADNFYNFGNSAVLNLNGDAGDDTFYVYASVSASPTNVGAGSAADSNGNKVFSYRVNSPVNIDGGTGNNKLFIFGTVLNDTFTITSTSVSGAGLDVNFTNIQSLTIAGLGGDDTFYIESISTPTTIIGDGTIVLPSVANFLQALNVNLPDLTGGAPPATSFNDTFYVGWAGASYIPGSLAGIAAPLTIYGDNGPNGPNGTTIPLVGAVNTIYVDDSADIASQTFNFNSATVNGGGVVTGTGFGNGGSLIYDVAVENLNFQMGNGNNTVRIDGNDTNSQTSIYGGRGNDTFIVNGDYPMQAPLAIFGGLNTFPGDSLTVNGATAGNTFSITGFTVDGMGATISYQDIEKLTVNAGGASTFNVNGDSIPTYLYGGSGNDSFNVNSNVVPLYIAGGGGNDSYVINANAGMLTVAGDSGNDAGNDSYTVNGNGGTLILNGGAGSDSFVINGNSGTLTVYGNAGNDSFTINALSSPATLNGGTGLDSFTIPTPLAASPTIIGGSNSGDYLTVDGTPGSDTVSITSTTVSGLGAPINYSATNLVVNGVAGHDTFLIYGTSSHVTRVNGGIYGNDIFNVQATTGALYLTGGSIGNNTFNLGSLAPVSGGSLASLAGPVFITGVNDTMRLITLTPNGINTVNVDDTGDTAGGSGTLTSSTLTGFGMGAGVTFVSVNYMNINLGPGNDTLNIRSTNSTTFTALNTGAGANIVNIGSNEPSGGGVTSGIQGYLTITGSGNDTMNVDDSGDTTNSNGTLTTAILTGLGMDPAGIVFYGFSALNINLGLGNDTFNVRNTNSATINTINTGGGVNVINVGSNEPSNGGVVTTILGSLIVVGNGSDTMNVDATGSTTALTGTLTSTTLTGLGMGAPGITYSGLAALNINLGPGNDTFNVQSTWSATVTTLNTGDGSNIVNVGSNEPSTSGMTTGIAGSLVVIGSGSDTLNVDDTGNTTGQSGTLTSTTLIGLGMGASGITYSGLSVLKINLGSGNDTFNVQSTFSTTVTTLNTGAGTNVVNVGSNEPSTSGVTTGIAGSLIVVGSGSDTMNVDDTGNTTGQSGTMTSTTLTGLGMGASGITYSGLSALNINLGSGNDTFNVQSTKSTTVTTLNTGAGANVVNVGSLAPATGGVTTGITGYLVVVGSGTDTMNVDDTGNTTGQSGTLTSTALTGLGMGGLGITYSGLSALNINLGSGNDTFNVRSTKSTTVTTLNTGAGANIVNVGSNEPSTSGVTTGIAGSLMVVGSGSDTLNVDDTGNTTGQSGTLTSTTLTGLGMGVSGITYSGLSKLNIYLGSGNDTFNVQSAFSTTVTTLNTGAGTNVVNVGSNEPSTSGMTTGIAGSLVVVGSGSDTMNVDDTGNTTGQSGTLTSTTLTGLGMGASGITYSGLSALNINLGSGNDTFNVQSTKLTTVTTLNTGVGANVVNVGSNEPSTSGMTTGIAGYLVVVGSGTDTMNVDDTGNTAGQSGTLTSTVLTGLGMGGAGINYSGLARLNISLGSGNDTFNVRSTKSTTVTTLNTGAGANVVNVGSNEPSTSGVTTGIAGSLIVVGSGSDTLNVDDTGNTTGQSGTLTSTTLTGLGMGASGITYSGLSVLKINLGSGNDTFNVQSTYSATVTTLNTGAGANVVNVGSNEPSTSGVTTGIAGSLIVVGSGSDTMNMDDTGNTSGQGGTLTSTTLTGLGMGASGITYSGLSALNINLGSGNDAFNVQSTKSTTVTTLNTGAGANVVNVGSLAPATGGVTTGIAGSLIVVGSGSDTMNVDATGSTTALAGTLTPTALTGLGMGASGITYSGLSALNISLGSGANTFTISNTYVTTVTTLNSGTGNDTVNLITDSGVTNINGQAGSNIINIKATGGTTTVNTGTGTSTVNVGSNAPATSGVTNGIAGSLIVVGSGTDTMNVDDTGNTTGQNGTLTSTTLTGLGMGASGITYSGLSKLNINLGSGNDTFNVQGTNSTTLTTLNTGAGANVVNVGSNEPSVGGMTTAIAGSLVVVGSGSDTMNVDDTGNTTGQTGTLTSTTLTGLGMGASGITYSGLSALNISLGQGNDTFLTASTSSAVTHINGDGGNDTFNVQATTGTLYITGSATGNNTFNLGSLAPLTGGTLNHIAGAVFITGGTSSMRLIGLSSGGFDTVNVDDTGDATNNTGTLTSSTLTGLGLGLGITFVSVNAMNINLGSGNDTFNVQTTNSTTVTTLNTGYGTDVVNVGSNEPSNSGVTTGIAGSMVVVGGGNDTLNVDDTGNTTGQTGTLTSTTLTGLGMGAGITYSGLSKLNINLGSGNDTFNVQGTYSATVTTLNTGAGANGVNVGSNEPSTNGVTTAIAGSLVVVGSGTDSLNVDDTGNTTGQSGTLTSTTLTGLGMGASGITYSGLSALNINLGSGNDTLNVRSTNSTTVTTLNTGAGANVVNVGSNEPSTSGVTTGIAGSLIVVGSGSDTMNVDDTGNTTGQSGTLTSTTLTGLGMGVSGITYTGLSALNVSLGSGGDTFNVRSTNSTTVTTVNTGAGANVVNVGSNEPSTSGVTTGIAGSLVVVGSGSDTMNVDDTGNTTGQSGTLTSTTLTGLGMGTSGITYSGLSALNINLGSGNDTFNVRSTNSTTVTTLNTGAGANVVNVGSNEPSNSGVTTGIAGSLVVVGSGSDTMYVDDTGNTAGQTGTLTSTTLTGLGMGASGITYSGQSVLNINLGSGNDTFNVKSTKSTTVTTVNTGAGTDVVNVGSNEPATGGVTTAIAGSLIVVGSGSDTMNVDDTGNTTGQSGTLTSTALTGLGMGASGITYSGLSVLNINLGSGNDTFNVQSTKSTTVTTLNTGSGTDVVNVGSNEPAASGVTTGIAGSLIVVGSGSDTMNVDATGSTTALTGTLTSTALTGLGMGASGITYSGLSALNINLGSGNDIFNVQGTKSTTVTTLNTGSGANVVNVGSNEPSTGGVTTGIAGALIVVGSGSDTLNVDATGSTTALTGTLTATALTGLGMGASGISYSGLVALNISLGSGGNTFTISNTKAATVTTLNSGSGNDTINLTTDSGLTNINGQAGNDTVNVRATGGTTNVNTGSGANTVNVGSLAPGTGGIVNNIQGILNVTGGGNDTMKVDDTGSTGAKTGTLTATTLMGLGMGASGISYSGLSALNINLGSGSDTFDVQSTYSATVTTLNTGVGANVVNVGSNAPGVGGMTIGIAGALIVVGSGSDTMNVDDTGNTTGQTGTLAPTTLIGLGMGSGGITYSGLSALNINLGAGSDTFTITGILGLIAVKINGGAGTNAFISNLPQTSYTSLTLLNFASEIFN